MLAEARRKVKFSFDPRNTNWTNDDNKFGQKLMEKMGWSKGRGLGLNEDGNPLHVAVSLKNDTKGVGWNKNNEDNWIAHQDDFNSLLSSLNESHNSGADKSSSAGENKILNLEQTSKSSKGRVHYKKFTRGKDLSSRSETDLDCVFGRRKSKELAKQTEENQAEEASDSGSQDNSVPVEDAGGLITVTSTDSVQDYFAKKMAAIKSRRSGVYAEQSAANTDTENSGKADNVDVDNFEESGTTKVKKKKKKKDKKVNASSPDIMESNNNVEHDENVKFSIGNDDNDDNVLMDVEECSNNITEEKTQINEKVKRKKSVRFSLGVESDQLNEENSCDINDVPLNSVVDGTDNSVSKKKKKKSKKNKKEKETSTSARENPVKEESYSVDGDKSNTKEENFFNDNTSAVNDNQEGTPSKKTKKSKKRKKGQDEDELIEEKKQKLDLDEEVTITEKKKTKKKKKKEKPEDDECDGSAEQIETQNDMKPDLVDITTNLVNPIKNKNPEEALYEYASKVTEKIHIEMDKGGPEHKPVFRLHVKLGDRKFQTVESKTLKDGRKKAAIAALLALDEEGELEILKNPKPVTSKKKEQLHQTADSQAFTFRDSLDNINGYAGYKVSSSDLDRKHKNNSFKSKSKGRFDSGNTKFRSSHQLFT